MQKNDLIPLCKFESISSVFIQISNYKNSFVVTKNIQIEINSHFSNCESQPISESWNRLSGFVTSSFVNEIKIEKRRMENKLHPLL